MRILFLNLILFLISTIGLGQNCNCETNYEWVKKTFEENDAGFQYVINSKGKESYQNHHNAILQKIKGVKNSEECTKTLYEWLMFFRENHIGIQRLVNQNSNSIEKPIKPKTIDDWETLRINTQEFENYLSSKKTIDFEGIWETEPYKIGIKKVKDSYLGFIVETNALNWIIGEVKVRFTGQKGTFYLRDKTPEDFTIIKSIGKNYLQLGRFTLKRLSPKLDPEKSVELHFKLITAEKPFFEELSSNTLLLRIPSFDGSQKKMIDSVIYANKDKILNTENLIIDVRNNGGGNDLSYKELIPLLYTNPIRQVGEEFLSTKLNNQRMLDFINNPENGLDAETKKWAKNGYDKLEKHLGQFVNLDSTQVTITKYDTVYKFPENVGIIINKGNASSTEQFLLAAKQSKKVKLFGATTMGVLDISNMIFIKSPCNEFELGYCLSKSFRIPEMTIDNKGIQPDYYIDNNIQDYKWIEFVNGMLTSK